MTKHFVIQLSSFSLSNLEKKREQPLVEEDDHSMILLNKLQSESSLSVRFQLRTASIFEYCIFGYLDIQTKYQLHFF